MRHRFMAMAAFAAAGLLQSLGAQDITVACAAEVRVMLEVASPPPLSMPLWLVHQDAPPSYRRNPAVWTGSVVDLSGKAVWNSCDGAFGTTAISPLHVVYAQHAGGLYPPGTVVRFVDNQNRVIERRVQNSVSIGKTDIDLSTLDRPLPASIHWFKVMPRRWFLTCRQEPAGAEGGLPCVVLDANTQSVAVKDIQGFSEEAFFTRPPSAPDRKRFSRELRSGDSGSPMFLLLGGELVLDGIYHWAVGGPELSECISELNAAMAGSGFRVTVANLFPFGTPPARRGTLLQLDANRPRA